MYEANNAQAFWGVPLFAEHQEVRANRVDARIINPCPWVTKREKKEEKKTTKYGPLRWELKQKYQGYEVKQYNIIMNVLGKLKELVGSKSKGVLHDMQKAVLSGTLRKHRSDV